MGKNSTIRVLFKRKEFLSVFIAVVNAFSWYFPLYLFFESVLGELQLESAFLLATFGIQCMATVSFAILGTALVKKFPNRETFLSVWMFIGIVTSASMIIIETFSMAFIPLVSFLLGGSLGLGFPICLAYFGDYTIEENRGLIAGITLFAAFMCMFFIVFLLSFSTLVVGALILAAWRGIGLLLFLLTKPKKTYKKETNIEVSYKTVLLDRSLLLYLVPWIMFCVINFLERPIVNLFFGEEFASFTPIAEFGIAGFVALIGGWFADSVGRKRVIIFGFVNLGVGYALLGLFQTIEVCWYLYLILDGIAWGIFSLMFYLVIWSELAGNRFKEKYYLLGVLPFLIASYIQMLFTPFAGDVDISAAFSLASFFLFIAVLPLLYAPETMPEKKMELKRLRSFAEEAQKAKEKYERKVGK